METPISLAEESINGFLIDNHLDQRSMREKALERAALISPLVKSVTIGPNSSFCKEEIIENGNKIPIKTESKATPPQMRQKTSPITSQDLMTMQHRMQQQTDDRRIQDEIRKKIEARLLIENDHYMNIQKKLEAMKIEAERKHKAKVEAYERQLAAVLQLGDQEELAYQNHRTELTKNTRKIIEHLKLEDHFGKLEDNFNKIVSSCSQEMAPIVDLYKKQFDELKAKQMTCRSSIDGQKSVCSRLEELCHGLLKTTKDQEAQSKAKLAQKKAEEIQEAAKAQAEAAHIQAQAQVQAQAQIQAQAAPPPQQQIQANVNQTRQLNVECGRTYIELMQFLNEKQTATVQLSSSPQLEALRFALKLSINSPINFLNETNKSTLIEGYQKLHNLLSGQRVETSKGAVSIADHPEANDWVKLRLTEKLIDACDKKPATTFYVAALTVALWQQFPDLGRIFKAKLFKECPFLLPYQPPQLQGQSDNEFLVSWGYRVADRCEEYVHYQTRTSRFAGLLAAMWITQLRRGDTAPHPCGLDHCWSYLGNVLNLPPNPMYLHLIDKVLETAGSTLYKTHGKQFIKLLMILRNAYLPMVERNIDETMKGAFDRLRDITLAKFFSENRLEEPKGKLPANYW